MLTPALSALRESLADQAERTEEQQHLLSELELLDAVFTV